MYAPPATEAADTGLCNCALTVRLAAALMGAADVAARISDDR
jgi:hypothetical protein